MGDNMANKRLSKKGYIYLLVNKDGLYKYGCTRRTPAGRTKRINYENTKYSEFNLIDSYKSNDIFKSECDLKWSLWASHMALSEYFTGDYGLILHIFNAEKLKHE